METVRRIYSILVLKYKDLSIDDKKIYFPFIVLVFLGFFLVGPFSSPINFRTESVFHIEEGDGLSQIAVNLKGSGFIKSSFLFKTIVYVTGNSRNIVAGDYYFHYRLGLVEIISRLVSGKHGLEEIRITIPEGLNIKEVAQIFKEHLSLFDVAEFLRDAPEGFLFPDTYFVLPNSSSTDLISRMKNNFDKKIEPLRSDISMSGITTEDLIIMASIIEEEAKTEEAKKIVSGILWKRIELGMPLQVDATFSYINGKNTYTLTAEDLKINSPYNTYTNLGLPPTPISNPGIESIEAALYPTPTEYVYFLSDLDGNMYYAEDFEGHQRNRELYLRK